jgi:hypothetical protein
MSPRGDPLLARNLDELIRVTASGVSPASLQLLAACGKCRNALLYLLGTPLAIDTRMVIRRLNSLPDRHRGHGTPGHQDGNPPLIGWEQP